MSCGKKDGTNADGEVSGTDSMPATDQVRRRALDAGALSRARRCADPFGIRAFRAASGHPRRRGDTPTNRPVERDIMRRTAAGIVTTAAMTLAIGVATTGVANAAGPGGVETCPSGSFCLYYNSSENNWGSFENFTASARPRAGPCWPRRSAGRGRWPSRRPPRTSSRAAPGCRWRCGSPGRGWRVGRPGVWRRWPRGWTTGGGWTSRRSGTRRCGRLSARASPRWPTGTAVGRSASGGPRWDRRTLRRHVTRSSRWIRWTRWIPWSRWSRWSTQAWPRRCPPSAPGCTTCATPTRSSSAREPWPRPGGSATSRPRADCCSCRRRHCAPRSGPSRRSPSCARRRRCSGRCRTARHWPIR